MQRIILFIVLLLTLSELSFTQISATTENGNKVILYKNGTWHYEEKSVESAETSEFRNDGDIAATIKVDSSQEFTTEFEELFYLPSPRLVKYFGEARGRIRCKVSCSNMLGVIKVRFIWEFPTSEVYRYFGSYNEGTKVTLHMSGGQTIVLVMGEDAEVELWEKTNYSMMKNSSLPLTKSEIATLIAQPISKIEVEWWKKKSEVYDLEISRLLMETLPTVF